MNTFGRGLLLCLGLLLLWAAFIAPLSAYAPRSLKHAWQLGHVGLFAIWTYLFLCSAAKKLKAGPLIALALLASLLLGFTIEWIQVGIGREFSLSDLLLDLLGCLLGICLGLHQRLLTIPATFKAGLFTLTALFLLLATAPLAPILLDEFNMHRKFPVLADFSSELEGQRWKGNVEIVQLASEAGPHAALRIGIDTRHYSGASLAHFYRDWRGYRYLHLEIFNPDRDSIKVTLRIHDDQHYGPGRGDYYDRYNRQFVIEHGWNSIRIELSDVAGAARERRIDLGRIQGLGLFTVDSPRHRDIYLARLRLSTAIAGFEE